MHASSASSFARAVHSKDYFRARDLEVLETHVVRDMHLKWDLGGAVSKIEPFT